MKSIPGFPNYSITKDGRVWSKPRKKTKGGWLKPAINGNGYWAVVLFANSRGYSCTIHQLLLKTYVGPCPPSMECRHLNGIQTDNRLENLAWGTHHENMKDTVIHGVSVNYHGEQHGMSKLTNDKVRVIRYLRDVAKFSLKDIAWQFDVAISTIGRICQRKTWRHLDAQI